MAKIKNRCIIQRCPECNKLVNVTLPSKCCDDFVINHVPNKAYLINEAQSEAKKINKIKKVERVEKVKKEKIVEIKAKRKRKYKKKLKTSTRISVLKRDNHKCVRCGAVEDLHVHHILPASEGGSDNEDNLETLCVLCHMGEHEGEKVYNLMIGSIFKVKVV